MKKLLLVLAFILSLPGVAHSLVYWASTSGGAASCAVASGTSDPGQYRTLAQGLACLSTAGDILNVKAGTYNTTIDTDVTSIASGDSLNPIRIVSVDGPRLAILRSIATRGAVDRYLVFDGFKTTGATLNDQAAVVYNTSNFVTHTNFEIDGSALAACTGSTPAGGCGEGLGAFGDNSTYSNGEIHNIHVSQNDGGGNSGHGIYLHNSNNVIDNLYVHDVGGQGIQVYNSGHTDVSNNTVKNSRWQNTRQSSGLGLSAIYLGNGTGNVAYNNVIYGSTYVGIQIGSQCVNCAAYNNTVVGVTNQAFEIYAGASGTITLRNNLLSGNGATFVDNHGGVTHDHNGCAASGTWCDVVGSLNFVNPGTNDYHLLPGSAAIDQGANLGSTYSPDRDGVARPTSGPWEIGAYEYGAPITPPSPQLVLALPLDDGSGTIATDVSGQKNNANFVGGVTWDNAGKYGKAIALDGTGYLNIPSSASLAMAPTMTLESWIYPTADPSGFAAVIVHDRYYLYGASDAGVCPAPSLAPLGGYSTTVGHYLCATSLPPINQWSHLAITHDGTTTTFYLNGNVIATQTSTDPMVQTSFPMTIGASSFGEYFVGKIDEPRVYNYARTPAQIVSDMNTPLIGLPGKVVEIAAPASVEISSASSLEISAD